MLFPVQAEHGVEKSNLCLSRPSCPATARADKIPQAILTKAFRGVLVPTEAEVARAEGRTYEPASELLARVRKEREGVGEVRGKGRRGR